MYGFEQRQKTYSSSTLTLPWSYSGKDPIFSYLVSSKRSIIQFFLYRLKLHT